LPYKQQQLFDGTYTQRAAYGIDFEQPGLSARLRSIPDSVRPSQDSDFKLWLCTGSAITNNEQPVSLTASAVPLSARKFSLAFYKGFNGEPNLPQGYESGYKYDCSGASTSGSVVFKSAIDSLANPLETDYDMLVIPGISHTAVTNYALSMVEEERQDCFYLMDIGDDTSTIDDVTSAMDDFDSSWVAAYYPWVQINDSDNERTMWVPPTTQVVGAISYTDKIAWPWYAPAGFTRGGLNYVIQAKTRLTSDEMDDLYVGRVNPVASFPNQGVVVWGQKTAQVAESALNRVNVRRLLIYAKRLVRHIARYLVFEQNVIQTWDNFLSQVNPIMESIQQNKGLYAFKVIMDASINTPDVIDQNILKGKIYLQPARTAEFISLDFIVTRTGVTFPS
jgi:hypothetical protein